jgi:hypothetical protein
MLYLSGGLALALLERENLDSRFAEKSKNRKQEHRISAPILLTGKELSLFCVLLVLLCTHHVLSVLIVAPLGDMIRARKWAD